MSHIAPHLREASFKVIDLYRLVAKQSPEFRLRTKRARFDILRWGAMVTDRENRYPLHDQMDCLYSVIFAPKDLQPEELVGGLGRWNKENKPAERNTLWKISFSKKGMVVRPLGYYRGDETAPLRRTSHNIWKRVIVLDRGCEEFSKPLQLQRFMVVLLKDTDGDYPSILGGRPLITKRGEAFSKRQHKWNFDLISVPKTGKAQALVPAIDKALKKLEVDELQRCWQLILSANGKWDFKVLPADEEEPGASP